MTRPREDEVPPDLCSEEEWDEFDDVFDDCHLPEGHAGSHFSQREDGVRVFWTTDGSSLLPLTPATDTPEEPQ